MKGASVKVLHVINSLSIGGAESLLVRHVSQISKNYPGVRNAVCVLGPRSHAAQEYIEQLPVSPAFLEFPGNYRNLRQTGACLRALRRLLRDIKPDIVHTYLWTSSIFTSLASLGLPTRRVSHVVDRRGDRQSARWRGRLNVRMTGWLLRRRSGYFAAVSEACRHHAITQYHAPASHVVTAHNGIDLRKFSPANMPVFRRPTVVIGSMSRFVNEKGYEYLVDAFRIVAKEIDNVRLTIAGDGPTFPKIEAVVKQTGLTDRISLPGRVESTPEFYAGLDVFVVPSVEAEGLPTTILEAMATGLPVIATDIGGATEVIKDEATGLIVPSRDTAALAAAIRRLVSSPEEAERMGRAGLSVVADRFSTSRMTQTIVEKIYQPLLSQPGIGRTI